MKTTTRLLLLLSILVGFSCLCEAKSIKPGTRFELPGSHFNSPDSKGWRVSQDGYQFIFSKKVSKRHTIMAEVAYSKAPKVSDPSEFLEYVRNRWNQNNDDDRYVSVTDVFRNTKAFSPIGIYAERVWKDTRTDFKRDDEYLFVRDFAHIFIHPHDNDIMVTLLYSVRHPPNDDYSYADAEVSKFIRDFAVEELLYE
ncbi:hypothetical protein [Pelagicoccus sp. SDUM812003]|uniref:hypothetical protein n=1 Tax=Pelagicoccus sp. SDUM812003 TaxID=3041267 RepID=UPI00280EC986|nr:hypothetical protein [Pelagicoccus sp. SDUM812003]MDQ8205836.1 hypothetical protein [Pelagicoccus sp. SDUM812003]